MKKLLLTFILGIFLISFISATIDLGTIKQGGNVTLYQSCPTCTYSDIRAIKYPNGTTSTVDYSMTKTNYDFVYGFTDTNESGSYTYTVCGNKGGLTYESCEEGIFEVTSGGSSPTTAQSIMYGIILFILLLFFTGSFIWFNNIEWGNYTNSEGVIVEVTYNRTKKTALFFLSYIFMLLLLFVGKSMTENFMFINDTPVFFDVFFTILLVSIAPVTIAVSAIIILTTISDNKLQEAIFRGLEIRR